MYLLLADLLCLCFFFHELDFFLFLLLFLFFEFVSHPFLAEFVLPLYVGVGQLPLVFVVFHNLSIWDLLFVRVEVVVLLLQQSDSELELLPVELLSSVVQQELFPDSVVSPLQYTSYGRTLSPPVRLAWLFALDLTGCRGPSPLGVLSQMDCCTTVW